VAAEPPRGQDIAHPGAGPESVTPYDRLVWTGEEAERLLASGERHQELIAFFGASEYRALAALARSARDAAPAAGTCRTLIVPGILGSQLGMPRPEPLPRDILWLDPIDIGCGRITELALPGAASVQPYGVLLYTYLGLKLQLRAAGIDAAFHAYDWRLGVDTLGRALARRVREESAPRIALVAHSLGGLVARAALALPGGEKIERVVLLGTPNNGSLAALQALRGTHWAVRKIAQLDPLHSSESLADRVFRTFPSLYHMLPSADPRRTAPAGSATTLDLLDPAAWPTSGPLPIPELLESARSVRGALAPPDERFTAIVGVGHATVAEVKRQGNEFVYRITRHGDGTVTADSARLATRNFHAPVSHSELTRDPIIIAAVLDLLRSGSTRRLAQNWRTRSLAELTIADRELGLTLTEKVDWSSLSADERRVFLEYLNEPPRLPLRVAPENRRGSGSRRPSPSG
jgi:pimeloyl-ACP methyl ester carboxylesterase